jgi:hypothetical protein
VFRAKNRKISSERSSYQCPKICSPLPIKTYLKFSNVQCAIKGGVVFIPDALMVKVFMCLHFLLQASDDTNAKFAKAAKLFATQKIVVGVKKCLINT